MRETIQIKALKPGATVGVANCRGLYRVIRRTRKNFYLVDFKGKEIEMPRNQIVEK